MNRDISVRVRLTEEAREALGLPESYMPSVHFTRVPCADEHFYADLPTGVEELFRVREVLHLRQSDTFHAEVLVDV